MKTNGVVRRLLRARRDSSVGKHSVCCAHGARGNGVCTPPKARQSWGLGCT